MGKTKVFICSCTLRQVVTLPHGKFAESSKFSEVTTKQTQSSVPCSSQFVCLSTSDFEDIFILEINVNWETI